MFSSPISTLRTGNAAKANALNSTVDTDDTCSLNSSFNEDNDSESVDGNNDNNDDQLVVFTNNTKDTTVEEEAALRRGRRETYAEPLIHIQEEEFRKFLTGFYRTIYKRKKECEELKGKYPDTIGKFYNEMVDEDYDGDNDDDAEEKIGCEDFWQRYFYRCDIAQIEKERGKNSGKKKSNRPKLENEFMHSVRKLFTMQ